MQLVCVAPVVRGPLEHSAVVEEADCACGVCVAYWESSRRLASAFAAITAASCECQKCKSDATILTGQAQQKPWELHRIFYISRSGHSQRCRCPACVAFGHASQDYEDAKFRRDLWTEMSFHAAFTKNGQVIMDWLAGQFTASVAAGAWAKMHNEPLSFWFEKFLAALDDPVEFRRQLGL